LKVFEAAQGQDKVMLTVLLHLAARRGEVFAMKWSDVDFQGDFVRLWTKKRQGGNKEMDSLPMTSELRKALLDWRQIRMKQPFQDKKHVFVSLDEKPGAAEYMGKPFKVRQHFMKRLCEKAGVKPFGFHAIRHLAASMLHGKGYGESPIQSLLRHQNPHTTSRYLRSIGMAPLRQTLEQGLGGLEKKPAQIIPFKQKALGRTSSEG